MHHLTAIVTAGLLALVRPSTTWAPVPPDRIEVIADDIALAAALHDGAPFRGPRRVELAAMALAAIAVHESNLAVQVVDCSYDGDPRPGQRAGDGLSTTAYQLMRGVAWDGHTRAELCPTGPLAAYVALKVLGRAGRCGTVIGAFRGYASGSCSRRSAASLRQCRMFVRAARAAGLDVSCDGRL